MSVFVKHTCPVCGKDFKSCVQSRIIGGDLWCDDCRIWNDVIREMSSSPHSIAVINRNCYRLDLSKVHSNGFSRRLSFFDGYTYFGPIQDIGYPGDYFIQPEDNASFVD